MRSVLMIILLFGVSLSQAAEQPTPGFMQPEVLQAAVAIGMDANQQAQFREALGRFVTDRMAALQKMMRRNNNTGIGRKFKKKTLSLLKRMDKEVAVFLTEEQMPAYQHYRDTLQDNLRGM